MKTITKLLLTAAFLVLGIGGAKAGTVITKTPIILSGGKFAECFTPGTYVIQMQGWQNFIAYEDATGVAFDENSTMVFDLEEATANGNVRVTFTFSDETTVQMWWCLGIGTSADDKSQAYNHDFDGSTFWLKKGLGENFDTKKTLNITKVIVENFNGGNGTLYTYKVKGGTFCDKPMTIKNSNTKAFGAYGGVFTATAAQTNIFKMENFEVGDYKKVVFKFGTAVPATGGWAYNYQSGVIPPSITVGATELEIPLNGTNLPELTIFNWNANPDPINISEAYLYKEESTDVILTFDDYGYATINKKYLTATGGLTYNPETGALSSDGSEGSLILEFTNPVDLRNLKYFYVAQSGSTGDILDNLKFYDEDDKLINTWNSIKLGNTWQPDGIGNDATTAFLNNKPVKKMVWPSAANETKNSKTATISSIEFTLKTLSCSKAGETQLNTLPWIKIDGNVPETPNWNMNVATDTYYGDYSSNPTHYVDLTDYDELRIYRDDNTGFRAFFINAAGTGTNTINHENAASSWNAEGKYWSIDLSEIEKWDNKVALKSIKSASSGTSNIVRNIVAYKAPAANAPQYILTGSGMQRAATVAALADVNATCIDATGVTGITTDSEAGRTLLTSANPNCLFLGTTGNGGLANTQNVITSGTCANLVLTDGYPFKAPADFTTATAASYTTTINAAGAGTLCLPFEAAIPQGVKAWTLTYTGGENATATKITGTIPANTPVLLNGSGSATFTGAEAPIDADATNKSGALTGVFEAGEVPTGSYVLQYDGTNIGFFKVDSSDPITINPFRAYLTAGANSSRISIVFENESAGIEGIAEQRTENVSVYDLQGRRVAQPTKGLYIVGGKKVIK